MVDYDTKGGIVPRMETGSDLSDIEQRWFSESAMTKVVLRVESEEQLLEVDRAARNAGIAVHVITDAGRTYFHGVPTRTCLAIGPDEVGRIDAITGSLRLL